MLLNVVLVLAVVSLGWLLYREKYPKNAARFEQEILERVDELQDKVEHEVGDLKDAAKRGLHDLKR